MKTILVIDDAPNIVELLRLYLEGAGYTTVAATDGLPPWNSTGSTARTS